MDNFKSLAVHVTLKGVNYLLWSRTVKTVLSGRGLWAHIEGEAPKRAVQNVEGEASVVVAADEEVERWYQNDQVALALIQSSLDPAIHEAYSYCESAKHLWDTLKKVYGNLSNLSRVYEVKKAISDLGQEDMEFTQWFGKYRSLWAELEMLRPPTVDPIILSERHEQDKVFGLMLNLNPTYGDLIRHLLRQDKLPSLEEVCGCIQREQGSRNLLGGKGELVMANKAFYRNDDKKVPMCEHCKRKGHTKDRCWTLHPHLKPAGLNRWDRAKANVVSEEMVTKASSGSTSLGPKGKAMAAVQDDYVRRADLEELIKSINALKDSGNSFYVSKLDKSLVIDSGANYHMINNGNLLENIEPTLGNVVIADGKRIPIEGIGNLRLFNKESKAFYIPTFKSNLLSVHKAASDLNCKVIFDSNKVFFQDIKSGQVLGEGVTKNGLYLVEETKDNLKLSLNSCLSSISNDVSSCLDKNMLWHSRLGHPHSRALNLLLPSISFKMMNVKHVFLANIAKSYFLNLHIRMSIVLT